MRKKSGSGMDDIKEISILTRPEQNELQNYFKKTEQRNGGISFYDFIYILNNAGYDISEQRKNKFNKDIAQKEIKIIDFPIVCWGAAVLKKQREQNSNPYQTQDNEYLDAFVALGGNIDTSGFIPKSVLISTLKNQFELIFDVDTLLEGLDGVENDRLDFKSFCELFEQDKKSLGRKNSVLSILSSKSLQNSDSLKSLVVNEKDFEKYLAKIEGHQLSSP